MSNGLAAAGAVRFRVLGPVEVRDSDGTPIGLGGRRQRTLLARLLAAYGAPVPVGELIDDVFGGAPPPRARATLQAYVSNVRRAVEPGRAPRTPPRLLVRRPMGYALAATDVDAVRFGELLDRADSRPPHEALPLLDEAVGLWRGFPYGEFCDEPWAAAEVQRLWDRRAVAVERRAQALLEVGRPQAVILDLEGETEAHPLRERLWCLLTLALYRTGRQAEALAVLRRARRFVDGRHGTRHGAELRALEADILRQADSLGHVPAAAVPLALDPSATGSPRRRQALHGRETQLAELMRLTASDGPAAGVVSGEPGIGKTSLLTAFRDRCARHGRLVLWGAFDGGGTTWPSQPWTQVLEELRRLCPTPDPSALEGPLDDQAYSGAVHPLPPRRAREVARWLVTAAREQPLVIVLDDLHRADPESMRTLREVFVHARAVPGSPPPITVVTALRGCSPHRDAVHDLLGGLAAYDLVRIRLGGLGTEAVRALAADLGTPVDERAARLLIERTGGNPLFLREVLSRPDMVPDVVSKLVHQWLAALGPQVRDVLRIAALIGRDFDPALVAEIAGEPGCDALDRAARAGLVVFRAGRMTFACGLARETIIGDIPPSRAAEIHHAVMISLSSYPGADVAVIARHAVKAGRRAHREAVRWARAAAEQASLRLDHAEAAVWRGRAAAAHAAFGGYESRRWMAEHQEFLTKNWPLPH
ncbi:BTAD domain-containing putative transcriptional regulator [Streptosporangium jomthongense]|uniref:BTAD domain-containing putative transcriptional regulator n=1 Tax=Streptosporangium jomthongense TaxID=1193683 RepID=A0ABV8F458_9ACTN